LRCCVLRHGFHICAARSGHTACSTSVRDAEGALLRAACFDESATDATHTRTACCIRDPQMCSTERTHNMLIGGIARGLRHADATPALRARTAKLGTAFQATAAAPGFHATHAGTCTMVQGGIATPLSAATPLSVSRVPYEPPAADTQHADWDGVFDWGAALRRRYADATPTDIHVIPSGAFPGTHRRSTGSRGKISVGYPFRAPL
jgi:hypothetical protein